ncbi:MAG: hypothetical protein ABIT08_13645 [Bacteroidia bacterium]
MEDFKLLFYLAVAIAWMVYKNYQKVGKNRPKTVTAPKTEPDIIDQHKAPDKISPEKISRQKQTVAAKIPAAKTGYGEFKKVLIKKTVPAEWPKKKTHVVAPFLTVEEKQAVKVAYKKTPVEPDPVKKEIFEEDFFELKKFDIRTAIIYSEILRRPQF